MITAEEAHLYTAAGRAVGFAKLHNDVEAAIIYAGEKCYQRSCEVFFDEALLPEARVLAAEMRLQGYKVRLLHWFHWFGIEGPRLVVRW